MRAREPRVSAVIIFKDEERFLDEAITSVLDQTFPDWELILVDDGSTDRSTEIARRAAAARPEQIRCVEHDGHANRGMSASRNLGITEARGRYVASLDGDDVWLPTKLEVQVAALERHPEAAMTFGPLLRWRTWTGEPGAADHEDLMGVGRRKFGTHPMAGKVVEPPDLLRRMLRDDYLIPGGALIRRDVLVDVGLYEPEFRGLYEDAVVMAKIALDRPVHVAEEVLYLYRMHPDSSTNLSSSSAEIDRHRSLYLAWVAGHLDRRGVTSGPLRRELRRAGRSTHHRRHRRDRLLAVGRSVARRILPRGLRDELRRAWRARTRPQVAKP